MADLTPEEIECRNELIQAGLEPELATTVAQRQVALRKEKHETARRERKALAQAKTSAAEPGPMVELDYRKGTAMPKWVQEAIETSLAIDAEDARSAGALGYMARAMVVATLPYRNPKNPDGTPRYEYSRRSGNFTLRIVAGYEGGIPYGVHPRMLLSWIASEAVRKKSPIIELGDSLKHFLQEVLDIRTSTGGERGSGTLVLEQIKRLFGSMVTAVYSGQSGEGSFALRNVLIANQLSLSEREMEALLTMNESVLENLKGEILDSLGEPTAPRADQATQLWTPQQAHEAGKWQSAVELSKGFYEECISSPVPMDLRAYRALKASPMAMDVYAWLTYRMSYLKRASRPIPWEALFMQFGTGLTVSAADPGQAVRDFKKAFLRALKVVQIVYPEAKVQEDSKGLVLLPSPTHVPKISRVGGRPGQGSLF